MKIARKLLAICLIIGFSACVMNIQAFADDEDRVCQDTYSSCLSGCDVLYPTNPIACRDNCAEAFRRCVRGAE